MKTYFFDIDGVMYDKKQINSKAFKVLKDKNINYYFCSGRGYKRTMDTVGNFIAENSLIIIENGSKIVDKYGNLVDYKQITIKEKKQLLKILDSLNKKEIISIIFNPITSLNYIVYKSHDVIYSSKVIQFFSSFKKEVLENDMTQITIYFQNSIIKEQFLDLCKQSKINAYKSDEYVIVNHHKVNKKFGINMIIDKEKLKLDNICVVGNDYNDIPMFEINCSRKIAIVTQNLPIKLKKMATDLSTFDDLYKIID